MTESKGNFLTNFLKKFTETSDDSLGQMMGLTNSESVRIIIPGAIDFSMVFKGDKKEVLDDIFERIKDLMSFMAERNEDMHETIKFLEKQKQDEMAFTDISVA